MSKEECLALIDSSLVEQLMRSDFRFQIPDYVYDVYTYRGKKNGKTRLDFFIDENNALNTHARCWRGSFLFCIGGYGLGIMRWHEIQNRTQT